MTVSQLLMHLIGICFYRSNVVDLPYSFGSIICLLGMDFGLSFLLLSQDSSNQVEGLLLWALYQTLFAFFLYAMLAYRACQNRFVKIWMALLGVHFVFNILSVLLYRLYPGGMGLSFLAVCVGLWNFMVNIFIFQQSLGLSRLRAFIMVLGLAVSTTLPISFLIQWMM
jgi:hypothetical protein